MDWKNFLYSGFTFTPLERETASKYMLLNSIMLIGMSLGVAMIIVHAWDLTSFSEPQQAIHLAIYNALSFLTMLSLRKSKKNFTLVRNIFYALSLAIISSDIILLDGEQARLAWYTVIIIPSFLLGGIRFGMIVLLWSIFLLVTIYFTFDLSYDSGEILYGIFLYVTVAALTSFYQKNKDDLYRDLEEFNYNLEERVQYLLEEEKKKNHFLLKQSRQAQMGEMISVIAHQWKQPLAAVSAATASVSFHLELLNPDDKEEVLQAQSFVEERMQAILFYVQSLSDTMDDFRNFFNPKKKKSEVCSIEAVTKALQILGNSLKNKNIVVKVTQNTQQTLQLHTNELTQVILNILKNSQDNFLSQNHQNSKITIEVVDDAPFQCIHILDNGGGIPEEHMGSIFDPYYSSKSEAEGTGIGLYMSRMIIEDHHHGELTCHNVDDGVCFTIKLPLQKPF